MEAKVPQRIDMEDRLIGPLTLQQFFYLLFGGLFLYLLNGWTANSVVRFIFYPIALIVGLLSLALAFVKIQERPFIYFLAALMRFWGRPKTRIWRRGQFARLVRIVDKEEEKTAVVPAKPYDTARVKELVKEVDQGDDG
ncbi:MAG: PrgI family protein [Patescibacteria group bacterium]